MCTLPRLSAFAIQLQDPSLFRKTLGKNTLPDKPRTLFRRFYQYETTFAGRILSRTEHKSAKGRDVGRFISMPWLVLPNSADD